MTTNNVMMLQKEHHQLQPKLSMILKEELRYIPQTYGALSDGRGKYCALAAVAKYFGYDVESDKRENDALRSSDLIPLTVFERIEDCVPYRRIEDRPRCTCETKNYFHCSLISLLIHLNDYHQMTFQQIGDWLESKGF
jgi:hypothetical protein